MQRAEFEQSNLGREYAQDLVGQGDSGGLEDVSDQLDSYYQKLKDEEAKKRGALVSGEPLV